MGDRGDRHFTLEDHLSLFVQLGAFCGIGHALGGFYQLVVIGIAPLGEVVAVHGIAAIQGAQPVVRVTVVAAPTNQHGVVFAGLGALEVLAPLVADDLGLDTDLGPIALQHFGHQLGIGVIRALHRHGPQGDLGAFLDAGSLEQRLGFLRVVGGVLDALVIRPLGWRHAVDGELAGALVHRVDDALLVHRHVQRLAHFEFVERRVGDVVGDIADVEPGLLRHVQVRVFFQCVQVRRAGEQGDLAFAGFEFLHAHGGVGVDGEDQVVDLHLIRLPVFLVALETDHRVLLVAAEHEWARADRLLVDIGGLASFEQAVGVFGGLDRGEAHRQVLDKGGVDFVEAELDGHVVEFFDLGDVCVHTHVGEVGELRRVGFAERVVFIEHALEGEQHVIGVEVAARCEVVGGVEFHLGAQVKGVAQAVFADVPLLGQTGDYGGAAALELAQAVEHGFRCGIEIGAGGVQARVKPGRAAFGAEHQVAGCAGKWRAGDQPSSE